MSTLIYDARRLDPFALLLGSGRGLDAKASRERDFAALPFAALLGASDDEVVAAFYQFRNHPQVATLKNEAATRVAERAWRGWWGRGLNLSLSMLGLDARGLISPWLLSDEHGSGAGGPGVRRTVHLADLRPDLPWFGVAGGAAGVDLRSLCGRPVSELPVISRPVRADAGDTSIICRAVPGAPRRD